MLPPLCYVKHSYFNIENGTKMADTIKILCVGDVVRNPGCSFLMSALPKFKKENDIDVCIVNGENSANGDGMLKNSCESIFAAGADLITGGDHTLRRREFYDYIENNGSVLRPANIALSAPGRGVGIIDKGAYKVGVINLLGTTWTDGFESAFTAADREIEKLKKETNIIVVDFHAEATSEKKALGYYLDGRVSAVFGTHTHVQTSDACVLTGGTGYITDVGMTGPEDSVLGIKKEIIIRKFTTGFTTLFEPADTSCFMGGCVFTLDRRSGRCLSANAVCVR